jgi:hypothetical protein
MKIRNNKDMEKLHIDLNWLGELVFENEIINVTKSNAVDFMRARVMEPLNGLLQDKVIPEASRCKYLWNNFSQ